MNMRLITVVLVFMATVISGWIVPFGEWAASAKSVLTIFAIFAAAILVRLNRGMPTIDWSKVDAEDRGELVAQIQKLAREYGVTLIFVGIALGFFLILDRANGDAPLAKAITNSSKMVRIIVSAGAGAIISFVLVRIAYVVWRDIDIVDLQAGVVSQAANAERLQQHNDKADAIGSSGVVNPHKKS